MTPSLRRGKLSTRDGALSLVALGFNTECETCWAKRMQSERCVHSHEVKLMCDLCNGSRHFDSRNPRGTVHRLPTKHLTLLACNHWSWVNEIFVVTEIEPEDFPISTAELWAAGTRKGKLNALHTLQ